MTPLWVIGAGGHAKVVIDTARAMGGFAVAGVLDDDPGRWGSEVLGVPVVAAPTPAALAALGVEWAVIAVGANRLRAALAGRLDGHVRWVTLVHPTAYVAPDVALGAGTVVCAGAIVQPGTRLGHHVVVNTASSIDHDGVLEDFVQITPGVHLGGGVRLAAGALLGIGCSVLPGCTIGAWTTVGAGAVVVRDLPSGVTAKGVPARYEAITPADMRNGIG